MAPLLDKSLLKTRVLPLALAKGANDSTSVQSRVVCCALLRALAPRFTQVCRDLQAPGALFCKHPGHKNGAVKASAVLLQERRVPLNNMPPGLLTALVGALSSTSSAEICVPVLQHKQSCRAAACAVMSIFDFYSLAACRRRLKLAS